MMMFKRLLLWLRSPGNTLWIQPALGALLAVFAALFAALENFEPGVLPEIGQDTLADLLGVLASSMLAVSTFSLSIMVSAFAAASNGATPRATELVMGDDRTRRAIASFISAFIYAIVAKIALGLEYYGQNGRFILFVCTVFVLIYLVVTLIMWVNTLSRLGGLNNTVGKIFQAASGALRQYGENPDLGTAAAPQDFRPTCALNARRSGYLNVIDLPAAQTWAKAHDAHVYIDARPGDFLLPSQKIIQIRMPDGTLDEDDICALQNTLFIENTRSYPQDPRHGLIVMSEVAQRAITPSGNDTGTVFHALTMLTRLLLEEIPHGGTLPEVRYDRVSLRPFPAEELVGQPFMPIIRAAADDYDISLRIQILLADIAQHAPQEKMRRAAKNLAQTAQRRTLQALDNAEDKEKFAQKCRQLHEISAQN